MSTTRIVQCDVRCAHGKTLSKEALIGIQCAVRTFFNWAREEMPSLRTAAGFIAGPCCGLPVMSRAG